MKRKVDETMPERVFPLSAVELRRYSSQFSSFGSDYMFSRITSPSQLDSFTEQTMRLRGMTIVLCMGGEIELEVNMSEYKFEPNSLMVAGSDSVIKVKNVDWNNLDAYIFVMSPEFIRDINFEMNLVATMSITSNQPQLMRLDGEEVKLLGRYFELIHYNTVDNSDARFVRSISRSLIAATVYQMMQFVSNRADGHTGPTLSRRANYVKEFLRYVNIYHRTERGVAFYAEKLFISPKYLSLIIKESTGRSAARWIDDYVIQEAKNMLRFSGKNVQQVAYELNFSNQSAFGKYFKHLTGMSPTKFQRS